MLRVQFHFDGNLLSICKVLPKKFISTQFVTFSIQMHKHSSLELIRISNGRVLLPAFYDPIRSLINIKHKLFYTFFTFINLLNYSSLSIQLSREYPLRIFIKNSLFALKRNFAFHIIFVAEQEKDRKKQKQEKFFIEIHAQRYRNTELKKWQKRNFKQKQQQIHEATA